MIQANELRIGNLVYLNDPELIENNEIYENLSVDIIDSEHIKMSDYFKDEFNKFYIAIPLSEKWLFKLGFKKNADGLIIHIGHDQNYELVLFNDNWLVYKLFDGATLFLKEIKYVHQLQNILFIMSDKELTLSIT